MPSEWTFGEVEHPEELEVEKVPEIPFTLVGYKVEEDPEGNVHAGERVEFEFKARGTSPQGSTMRLLANADAQGNADARSLAKWIHQCLVADDRDRWWDTLDDDSVHFESDGLAALSRKLMEHYGERPTRSRSERRAGARRAGQTSRAGRAAKASA